MQSHTEPLSDISIFLQTTSSSVSGSDHRYWSRGRGTGAFGSCLSVPVSLLLCEEEEEESKTENTGNKL